MYNEIYMHERKGVIKRDGNENARVYRLTQQGQKKPNEIADKKKEMKDPVAEIFKKISAIFPLPHRP